MSTIFVCDWCGDEFSDRSQVASVDMTVGSKSESLHMCASCAPDFMKSNFPDA